MLSSNVIGNIVLWVISMLTKGPIFVQGTSNGKRIIANGVVYGFAAEDGSGHNWLVTVGDNTVFVHI